MRPSETIKWCHQQESNLYLALRRHSFYPLNYGGWARSGCEELELYALAGSVIGHGKDQVDGALLAGLGANREALRQVIENIQRAQGA
jgi:hypothetical protein